MTGAAPSSTPMVSTPMVKTKVFAGLGDTALRQILGAARVRYFAPNKDVIVSGGRPEHLFLLQVGRARSYILTKSGSEILLSWKVPGDIVGLASLLPNPPAYRASATTVSECKFLVWDHGTIRRFAKVYPQLGENGFRLALHYLGKHIERHVNVLTKSAETRLAEVLHRLASEAGTVQRSGVRIDITNEHLSSLADISPFTTSRLLSMWERDGTLSKQRGRITLHVPESLMIT
jgi:CRP/FNR family transcriptional regulator, nitrogen oxide reductase regulator